MPDTWPTLPRVWAATNWLRAQWDKLLLVALIVYFTALAARFASADLGKWVVHAADVSLGSLLTILTQRIFQRRSDEGDKIDRVR